MSIKEKEKLLEDSWSKSNYPYGKKGLVEAIEKASKLRIFDLEETRGHLRAKHS